MMQGGYGGEQGYGGGGVDPKEEEQQGPWYVKYGIRALGTFAGGLCLFLGAFNVLFNVFSPTCILFAIWQMLVGFVVVTIEAPFCCAFVDKAQMFARKIEERPLMVKAVVYFVAPLPTIFFCFGFYSFIGGGLVTAMGVMYGMIALGKKASREEMARNAQQTLGGSTAPASASGSVGGYQPQSESVKNPFSTINISRDPIAAAAAEWASKSSQSVAKFEPPPSYNSSVGNNQAGQWDQTFVDKSRSSNVSVKNPVGNDPNNPFQ